MVIGYLYLSMNLLTFFLPESRFWWKLEVIHIAESYWEAMSQALCYAQGMQRWGKAHALHLWRILQPSILKVGRKPRKGKNMCRRKVGLIINKYFLIFQGFQIWLISPWKSHKWSLPFIHGPYSPTSLILQIASGLLGPCLESGVEMLGRSFCSTYLGLLTRKTRSKEIKQPEEIMKGVHDEVHRFPKPSHQNLLNCIIASPNNRPGKLW